MEISTPTPDLAHPQTRTSGVGRTVVLLTAASSVVAAATTVVAVAARSAGASTMQALTPAVYIPFAVIGLLGGYVGWLVVRRLTKTPARVLSALVPIALLVSWVPDVLALVTGYLPGASITGVAGLMLMHLITVAVGVPVYNQLAPVSQARTTAATANASASSISPAIDHPPLVDPAHKKHLLVLGGTGATGQRVLATALEQGHDVTALVRSPEKVTITHPHLTVLTGQATAVADVERSLGDATAVISTLGAKSGTVVTDAVNAILGASQSRPDLRIVLMSSFVTAGDDLPPATRFATGLMMKAVIADRRSAETVLRRSGRSFVIVKPARLTNGPRTGRSAVLTEHERMGLGRSVSRADVASWLVSLATAESAPSRDALLAA